MILHNQYEYELFYILAESDIDSKKYASQGQQRTVVLALKLAELQILKEKCHRILKDCSQFWQRFFCRFLEAVKKNLLIRQLHLPLQAHRRHINRRQNRI